MRVVALGQQKGGVGKSATAIHLACQAILAGKRTALLDLDNVQKTALDWGRKRMKAIAGDKLLIKAVDGIELDAELERLKGLGFEWVFLDLPGRRDGSGLGMSRADFVLMPARPLAVDIEASYATLQVLRSSERPHAYLMNICPPQDNASRARKVQTVLEEGGAPVCPAIIIQRIVVPDAIEFGNHVGELPGAQAEQSASEYKALFDWLNQKIEDKDAKPSRSKAKAKA